jgi:hypothetical protein
VYVYYTFRGDTNCEESREVGPVNVCSRFEMNPSTWTLDRSTEKVLFRSSRLEVRMHNAGNMAFGADGRLWVAVGDGGSRTLRLAQDRGDITGVMVRLAEDGDVPGDNPYAGDPNGVRCAETGAVPEGSSEGAVCQEIFAYGLRNPFKIAMDPNAAAAGETRFYINDVGGKTWEEINECGTEYAGANYGWPVREGPCSGFGNGGNNVEDCHDVNADLYTDPVHWYLHSATAKSESSQSGCVVGGAFVPNDSGWPATYTGRYMFMDFVFETIYLLEEQQGCRECDPPASGFSNSTFHTWPKPIAMQFGPAGNKPEPVALYYVSRDEQEAIRRIVFVGACVTSFQSTLYSFLHSLPWHRRQS